MKKVKLNLKYLEIEIQNGKVIFSQNIKEISDKVLNFIDDSILIYNIYVEIYMNMNKIRQHNLLTKITCNFKI